MSVLFDRGRNHARSGYPVSKVKNIAVRTLQQFLNQRWTEPPRPLVALTPFHTLA